MKRTEKVQLIETTRQQVSEYQEKCDQLYQQLTSQLKLKENTTEESYLFDLIFNYPDQNGFKESLERLLKML
jgi:hypothetical protein